MTILMHENVVTMMGHQQDPSAQWCHYNVSVYHLALTPFMLILSLGRFLAKVFWNRWGNVNVQAPNLLVLVANTQEKSNIHTVPQGTLACKPHSLFTQNPNNCFSLSHFCSDVFFWQKSLHFPQNMSKVCFSPVTIYPSTCIFLIIT